MSGAVESVPIDDGRIFWEAEEPGFRVSGLREWGDGAYFDVGES